MFTGLVECTGTVVSLRRSSVGVRLTVASTFEDLAAGESMAVNGVCQTVTGTKHRTFSCDVLAETLRITNLGMLRRGEEVNLERALRPGDRMGGHIVNGHVDGVGVVRAVSKNPPAVEVAVAPDILKFIVPKGSVAVNGVSLTVGPEPGNGRFEVFIIPHTWRVTNLKNLKAGSTVNIEVDIVGKYVFNYLRASRERA